MGCDQDMADVNPNDIVERTVRNLNSEKLVLRRQAEDLQKRIEYQSEIINQLTYEKANIIAEKSQLQQLYNENKEQGENLEASIVAQDGKIDFLDRVATQNDMAMKDLCKKVEEAEVWTQMCKETIVHTNDVEEAVYQQNINLKLKIEFLVRANESMRNQIQSISSNEKILKQKSIEVKLQLETSVTYQHQLKENLDQIELQHQSLMITRSYLELQIKDLELKSENLVQEGFSLKGESQSLEAQIQILISDEEQLEAQNAVVISSNEDLVNEANRLHNEAQKLNEDVDAVDKKLLELEVERDLQNAHLASVTSSFESLTKSKEAMELESHKVLQEITTLKAENASIKINLNSLTLTRQSLKEDLRVSQDSVASLQSREKLLVQETESLKKNILDVEENCERERARLRSDIDSHAQAEDVLKQALRGLQDRLIAMDVQKEEQLKKLEDKCLDIGTLQSNNQCLEGKVQDFKVDVQRLDEIDLQKIEEIAVLQRKCVGIDALSSRINSLSLENDELKIQVAAAEEITDKLKQEVRHKVNESEDLKSLLKKLEQDLEEKLNQVCVFEEKIRFQNQNLGVIQLTEKELEKEIDGLKNQLQDLGFNSTLLEQKLAESLKKINELESELQLSVDASIRKAAAQAELSQAFETLVKTWRQKEEQLMAEKAAILSEVDSNGARFNMELEAVMNDLEAARDENQKLQSLSEEGKRRIQESETLKKSLSGELVRAAQEKKRLSISLNETISQEASLVASLNEKTSTLEKMQEVHHRLMKEKEHNDSKLTSYMTKSVELEATIRYLRNDINDMTVVMPAAASAKPYSPFLSSGLLKEHRRVGANKYEKQNPEKVAKRTPSKSYSRQKSAPTANPRTVAAERKLSPTKPKSDGRAHSACLAMSTDIDLSFCLDDTFGFSQPKASGGTGLEQAAATKTGVVAKVPTEDANKTDVVAKALAKDAKKNKVTPRFFHSRRE